MKATVEIPRNELTMMLDMAQVALAGDSNDSEHDALYRLAEWLEELTKEP